MRSGKGIMRWGEPIPQVRTRNLVLYPLSFLPKAVRLDSSVIKGCLSVDNVLTNSMQITNRGNINIYSVIVDKVESDMVLGRFVKLKKDNIEKLRKNQPTQKIEEILEVTGIDEYIEANSYFVWNLINNLMLAEYNPESLNVLTRNSSKVLAYTLSRCNAYNSNISLEPFLSQEFIQEIIQNKGSVYKYRLLFKDINKKYLESQGMTADLIWKMAKIDGFDLSLGINIAVSQTLTDGFYQELKVIADRIRGKAKKYVVYTDEGNFDLIGDKYIYYNRTVSLKDTIAEYRKEIYDNIRTELQSRTESLESIRRIEAQKQQTLPD